jgi:hypothetical protein
MDHPTNIIFKTSFFLQLWTVKARPSDREGLMWLISELRELYAFARPRNPSPSTHPDPP